MTGAASAPPPRRGPRLDALPDLVFDVDADLHIVAAHVGREADLATTPGQFLGRRVDEVVPPDVFRGFSAARDEAHRTGGVVSYEYRLTTQVGEVNDFEGRCVPLADGGTLIVVRNVTRRRGRRTAAALSALQASVDASADLATMAGLVEWLTSQVREGQDDEPDARRERADAMLETLSEVEEVVARLRLAAAELGGDAARLAGPRPQGSP